MKEIGRGIREFFAFSAKSKLKMEYNSCIKCIKRTQIPVRPSPGYLRCKRRRPPAQAGQPATRMAQISCCFRRPPVRPRWTAGVQFPGGHTLSATIVYQSAVRASSPKHKSGAHGEACELADSRSNGFRNCSGSRRSGHDPAAGRESGSNRRWAECCPEFSRTVEMNERNKIKILLRLRQRYAIIEAYKAGCRFSGPGACLEVLL